MAGYTVTRASTDGIVTCRITGALSDGETGRLAADLSVAIAEARREHHRLRLFWDNREGLFPSRDGSRALVDALKSTQQPGDRCAILVSTCLMKARARQDRTHADAQVFVSKAAAMTWLNAWEQSPTGSDWGAVSQASLG